MIRTCEVNGPGQSCACEGMCRREKCVSAERLGWCAHEFERAVKSDTSCRDIREKNRVTRKWSRVMKERKRKKKKEIINE